MDHLFCFKLRTRIGSSTIKEQREAADKARRYALTAFETSSVYLSLSISALFFSYWTFSNQPEYALISFLFFMMSFMYFTSSFWRKVTMLNLKRKFIEKQDNDTIQKNMKIHNSHLTFYQILLSLDTLWFCSFLVTVIGICLNLPEVFNNVERPDFCL